MANVPATIPGDYYGTGPGIDFGDIYGPNSWACRTLGIGCGNGGGGYPAPYPGGGPIYNGGWGYPPNGGGYGYPAPNGAGAAGGYGGCPTMPFRAGASMAARAVPFVLPNPVSGKPVWFLPGGAPLLWSGDLRAVRRVSRIASRAARFTRRGRRRRGGR